MNGKLTFISALAKSSRNPPGYIVFYICIFNNSILVNELILKSLQCPATCLFIS